MLPVQQGSQFLGYVGSEFGGGLKFVAVLFVLIHLVPGNTYERTSPPVSSEAAPKRVGKT